MLGTCVALYSIALTPTALAPTIPRAIAIAIPITCLTVEVTRLVVVERLADPPSSQVASWFPKSLRDLFSGPERTAQPERATGYATVGN